MLRMFVARDARQVLTKVSESGRIARRAFAELARARRLLTTARVLERRRTCAPARAAAKCCALAACAVLAACNGGGLPPPPAVATGDVQVELADATFAALTDGEQVALVAGAQGGFHVWMSYRLSGVAAGRVTLERLAHRAQGGELVLRSSGTVDVAPDASGAFSSPDPLPMFMCPTPVGLSIVDAPIVFELRFSAEGAPLADRSVTLVPRCPDAARELCERICTG
jgi:hypothetical protein